METYEKDEQPTAQSWHHGVFLSFCNTHSRNSPGIEWKMKT